MNELLASISDSILEYKNLKDKIDFNETETVLNLMKSLSSDLFFLEEYLDNERQDYYSTIISLLKDNNSVTKSEKLAKNIHPKKRKLERLITSAYKVLDSMKSHQSFLKNYEACR